MGWLGTQRELRQCLERMNADQDARGRFIVKETGTVAAFLGIEHPDNEVLINDLHARVNGAWTPVQPAGGLYVTVI